MSAPAPRLQQSRQQPSAHHVSEAPAKTLATLLPIRCMPKMLSMHKAGMLLTHMLPSRRPALCVQACKEWKQRVWQCSHPRTYLIVVLPPGGCHRGLDGELIAVRLVLQLHLQEADIKAYEKIPSRHVVGHADKYCPIAIARHPNCRVRQPHMRGGHGPAHVARSCSHLGMRNAWG